MDVGRETESLRFTLLLYKKKKKNAISGKMNILL